MLKCDVLVELRPKRGMQRRNLTAELSWKEGKLIDCAVLHEAFPQVHT